MSLLYYTEEQTETLRGKVGGLGLEHDASMSLYDSFVLQAYAFPTVPLLKNRNPSTVISKLSAAL